LKVKRAAMRACVLGALLVGESRCARRDEVASPARTPPDHSKKSSSSLPFTDLSFEEALARARAEKKLVFVDLYADWCGWCTRMDEDVFTNARVQHALLDFIPIKVDADRGGGRSVAARYSVTGLPAFLLLNGDGEVVRRFDGYLPIEEFLVRLGRSSGAGV
jgi:thiol:disulfide interchange protein